MAEPATLNFTIFQGTTLEKTFTCRDDSNTVVDISGYNVRIAARLGLRSSTTVFDYNSEDDTDNLTVPNDSGYFTLTIDSTTTAALDFDSAIYVIELYDGSTPPEVHRLAKGIIRLDKEVTSG